MKKYILELAVAVSGAVVMIYELAGSRVLAPYMGTSLVVWTSIIGVILGSLSLGYYFGGRLADNKPSYKTFSLLIMLAGLFIAFTAINKTAILLFLQSIITDIRISSVIASIVLFTPASIVMGMVSPYAIKLKLDNLSSSGSTVGSLYAISTIGSIVGTFLAGFWLIPYIGISKLIWLLALIMAILSILIYANNKLMKVGAILLITLGYTSAGFFSNIFLWSDLVDVDTPYNRIWVYDGIYPQTDRPVRILSTDAFGIQGGMYLDDVNEQVFPYAEFYRMHEHFVPLAKETLTIGGGIYSYPKELLQTNDSINVDVVEIDPGITQLSREYFELEDNPRLQIFHEDGRSFLNQNNKKYDVIFFDVFNSWTSIPYQLTTQEAIQKIYDSLSDDGVLIANIIASINGDTGQFLRAEYATYKEVFPQVYLMPASYPDNGDIVQNVILVAGKSKDKLTFISNNSEIDNYLKHLWTTEVTTDMPIITDDYAPVDHYYLSLRKSRTVLRKYFRQSL